MVVIVIRLDEAGMMSFVFTFFLFAVFPKHPKIPCGRKSNHSKVYLSKEEAARIKKTGRQGRGCYLFSDASCLPYYQNQTATARRRETGKRHHHTKRQRQQPHEQRPQIKDRERVGTPEGEPHTVARARK